MANKNTLKCNKQNNIVTSSSINNGVQCFILWLFDISRVIIRK